MFDIKKGEESGIEWTVDSTKFNPIVITVNRVDNKDVYERVEHNLLYPNAIFGYDVSDVYEVEEILNKLIDKLKGETK